MTRNDSVAAVGSVGWVCEQFPAQVRAMFAALDLQRPALSSVSDAVESKAWETACESLLDYYQQCESGDWLRHDPVSDGDTVVPAVERMAQAWFPLPGGEVQLPRLASGSFDWGHIPSGGGGEDWACGVNRHDYMSELLRAFYATGNRRYVRAIDEQLCDWTASVERPTSNEHIQPSPWATILEVGHRLKVWPALFYGLQTEPEFSPATCLLMLCRALEHAEFLRQNHSHGSNWVITEMAGLLSFACAWPEFRQADKWRDFALRTTLDELDGQVYPDGVQKELAANYQLAVLDHMRFFMATVRGAKLTPDPRLYELLEKMWHYIALSLGPTGQAPHSSDSDRPECYDSQQTIRPLTAVAPLLEAAQLHHREDWRYIATHGDQGIKPGGLPSVLFPWAGHMIMRSGWDREAHWAFFDMGPWGILHQHNDALHLSITAHGRDLLVDSGRYTYDNYWGGSGNWRGYFIGSAAHNVILVDGLEQANGPTCAAGPVDSNNVAITPQYDYAQATFSHGFTDTDTAADRHKAIVYGQQPDDAGVDKTVVHTRAILYLRSLAWIVVDHIATDRPRDLTALWHFHPECTVVREDQSVMTVDPAVGNLRIDPIGSTVWDIELVRGREGAEPQGWYSPLMDVRLPNTCATYATSVNTSTTFVWLLTPGKGHVPRLAATMQSASDGCLNLLLDIPDREPLEVEIRLDPPSHRVAPATCTN